MTKPMIDRLRSDIVAMPAYSSARSLYTSQSGVVFLDANECPYEPYIGASGLSRYPSQQPKQMTDALCRLYDVSSRNMLVTRGADEGIDTLLRAACVAGRDNIIICPPTFPMYDQSAMLQGAQVIRVPLTGADFAVDVAGIQAAATDDTKIIFLCSPNNPTGTLVPRDTVLALCAAFDGRAFVVVDETYIEYAGAESLSHQVERTPNLIVLRTLSKAYAAAGLRCGVLIAQSDVTAMLRKVLAPYPIPAPVAREVCTILADKNIVRLNGERQKTLARRDRFIADIRTLPQVVRVFDTAANFVLVQFDDAAAICKRAADNGIILRNQSHQYGLEHCVRISIGSDDDMDRLTRVLRGQSLPSRAAHRTANVTRKTSETAISVQVDLDATSPVSIATGIGFYDHMLDQIARHAGIAMTIACEGDLHIDPHHTVEDCAIALGIALREALGDKRGIGRYGFTLPMDEAQASCTLDLSGRFLLDFDGVFPAPMVGDLPTDMVAHVFRSLAENLGANAHISVRGDNAHHMVEGCFKAFARALRQAIAVQGSDLPSSKGVL